MQLVHLLLLISQLLLIVNGWTSRAHVPMDPNDPTFCLSDDPLIGRLKLGESKSLHPHQCVRATCSPGMIQRAGCGVIGATPPDFIGEPDLSKPYPDCCPKLIRGIRIDPLTISKL
ncbi:hypothetical protein PPYR_08062 [Photinus pyralis]|uniref:Single domain-containing protein n=1 Tax=Photinus pyralis TaxID=7054 RepID=A0A1Y1KS23_PHOPY|nr:uncharacterized protein LOC116171585 [Photinus pyralis]KAB0797068.1 hypothetical protein PPYR_08062 [Photinus pyralis]